jgi:hypothetical protein
MEEVNPRSEPTVKGREEDIQPRSAPPVTLDIPLSEDVNQEVWQNVTRARFYIQRVGEYGKRYDEMIGAGKKFVVTPYERRINEQLAASEGQNMFRNGTFQAVRLNPDEPDTQSLLHNPNNFTDEEGKSIFKLKGENFRKRIAEIDNATAMDRLKEVAYDPKVQATVHQLGMIESRLKEISHPVDHVKPGRDTAQDPSPDGGIKAVTPA